MSNKYDDYDASLLLSQLGATIFGVVVWAILHTFIGIYLGWAFFSKSPTVFNFIYYAFLVFTTVLLFRFLRKKWQSKK